jgi:O-antigen ligase
VLVQLLNPANQSLAHSVAALRQHIEFVPLFFIAYTVMRSKDRIRLFFLVLLAVTCVNAGVALVQFNMTPDQLAGWGPGYSDLINGVGAAPRTAEGEDGERKVRPPGLGSDMGFAGNLGAVALPGALALLALGRFNRRQAILAGLMTPGAVIAIVTSQSRSVAVVGVVALLVFGMLALVAGQARRLMLAILAVGVLALAAVSFVGSQSGDGAFHRYSSVAPSEVFGTTVNSRSDTIAGIPDYIRKFPLGAGIGSVGPAANFMGEARPLNAESQFTFMIVEVGILGLLVFIAFQARLLGLLLARLRRLKDDEARLLLVGLVTPLVSFIALWVIGVTTTSTPNAPYIWFAAGTAVWWLARRDGEADRTAAAHS